MNKHGPIPDPWTMLAVIGFQSERTPPKMELSLKMQTWSLTGSGRQAAAKLSSRSTDTKRNSDKEAYGIAVRLTKTDSTEIVVISYVSYFSKGR